MKPDEVRLLLYTVLEHLKAFHGLDAMVRGDAHLGDMERLIVSIDGRDIFRTESPAVSDVEPLLRGGFHPVKH